MRLTYGSGFSQTRNPLRRRISIFRRIPEEEDLRPPFGGSSKEDHTMARDHRATQSVPRRLGWAAALILPMAFLLAASVTASAASPPNPGNAAPARHCVARCHRPHTTIKAHRWDRWCRRHVMCAIAHLYLHPHFGLRGPIGEQLKPLPEGLWIRRFVRQGWVYKISPRILLSIGLIESYGGTTSTAYMGCLDPKTYGSRPKQIHCATHVLRRYGLAATTPTIRAIPRRFARKRVASSSGAGSAARLLESPHTNDLNSRIANGE